MCGALGQQESLRSLAFGAHGQARFASSFGVHRRRRAKVMQIQGVAWSREEAALLQHCVLSPIQRHDGGGSGKCSPRPT